MLAIPPSLAPFVRGAVEFGLESPKYWTGPRLQPPVPAPIIPSPSQPTPSNPSPNGSNTAPVEPQPFPIPEIKPQNPSNSPYITDPQADIDHEDYKKACGKRLPGESSGDRCTKLRAMLERYRRCAELREAWDNKWNPGRHAADIWDAKRACNKALEQIKRQCPPKNCPPQNGGGEPPPRDENGNLIA